MAGPARAGQHRQPCVSGLGQQFNRRAVWQPQPCVAAMIHRVLSGHKGRFVDVKPDAGAACLALGIICLDHRFGAVGLCALRL